jgi:hypothetical protein
VPTAETEAALGKDQEPQLHFAKILIDLSGEFALMAAAPVFINPHTMLLATLRFFSLSVGLAIASEPACWP